MDYVRDTNATTFRFRAQMLENPLPTAMVIPSNISEVATDRIHNGTNITSVSALSDWQPKQLADMYKLFYSSKNITDLDKLNNWGNYFENTKLGNDPGDGTTSWLKNSNVQNAFNTQLGNWANPSHGRFTMTCDNSGKLTVNWNNQG